MPLRPSTAQIASARDSSVTQLSSSQLSSRASVSSNMGRRCAHDGCNRLSLTGGPKCHSHTPKPQASPTIRGSAQMLSTDSLSPENMKNESASPRRTGTMSPAAAAHRRSGESQYPPHPAKGLSHKSLPAKATARKSIAKPGQRREDSNSAAADESEIIVASDSTTSTNKSKVSKRAHDNLLDSPRKKPRISLSNATAESDESEPPTNGGTHKVTAKRLEQSASRLVPQPETTTATPAVSSASLGTAQIIKTDEKSRLEPRGRETLLPKTQTSLDTSLHGKSKEGKLKKKMVWNTSVAESTSEKLRADPPAASIFHPREGTVEREKSNGLPPPQEQSLGKSGQGGTSSSTVEPNKVHDTIPTVSRAPSVRDKETHPIARDAATSARDQSVSSRPIHTLERRPNAKNEYGQNISAAPRQTIPSKHSMRTTEILSHGLEKTKSGMKAPVAVLEDSRGLQGHHLSSNYPQRKEVASKRQPEHLEHSSVLPQRTKGHLVQNEVDVPLKNNRLADKVGNVPEKTELPFTNGVASTAKLDTTGTQLRKEGNGGIETAQPPRNSPMVIDLVSSDSDSPVPSKAFPQTTSKTKPPSNESQAARSGLRMPSVNIGPIPTLTGVPPNPGPSANGLGEPRQVWQRFLSTGEPIATGPESKTQISQKPSASSEPIATMSGHKTSDLDKPLLKSSHRWTNVTPERWRAFSLAKRRQMLQDQHDESKFDEFIYGPANAANHPLPSSRGKAPAEASPRPISAPPSHFRHFDPRVHWTHARPKEWHERKQKEIADRGNRKAPQNFGRAAARRAQLKARVRPRKVDLPERVEKNPKWVAALAELDDMAKSYHEEQRAKARLRKKKKEAAKDRDGDTEMQDVLLETPDSTKDALVIGGMRRPLLEVMIRRRWRKTDWGVNEG